MAAIYHPLKYHLFIWFCYHKKQCECRHKYHSLKKYVNLSPQRQNKHNILINVSENVDIRYKVFIDRNSPYTSEEYCTHIHTQLKSSPLIYSHTDRVQ